MAQLRSVGVKDLVKGAVTIYTVPDSTPYAKISEIIVANHTTSSVTCKFSIYKAESDTTIIIVPELELIANQNQVLAFSTCLNTHDKVIIESHVSQAIDVY